MNWEDINPIPDLKPVTLDKVRDPAAKAVLEEIVDTWKRIRRLSQTARVAGTTSLLSHNHDSDAAGHGGILTNDRHDGYSRYDVATSPTAATDAVFIAGVDFGVGDTRLQVVSETGNKIWIGNGGIQSASGNLNVIAVATLALLGNSDMTLNATDITIAAGDEIFVTATTNAVFTGTRVIFAIAGTGNVVDIQVTGANWGIAGIPATITGSTLTLQPVSGTVVNLGGGAVPSVFRHLEGSGGGSNYFGFKAAATMAASLDYTLPDAAPTADGQSLISTTAGVMSWGADQLPAITYEPTLSQTLKTNETIEMTDTPLILDAGVVVTLEAGAVLHMLATVTPYQLLETSGPTVLTMAGVADGEVFVRSGTTVTGKAETSLAWEKGYMDGLRLAYVSATTITVAAGQARDDAGAANITLAASVTVDITTLGAAAGLDRVIATATATTHGTATFEPSASLYSETALSSTVRTLTGTMTTVGTAVTGTGTKFLSEVTVFDVVRSATKGASRITAIASDTAMTLSTALPGGDCTTEAMTLYENLVIWPDTSSAGDERRPNTITHAGTSVVLASAVTSNGAGKTIAIGSEKSTCWYHPWLVTGGSGTTVILSTQRTTPYGVTNYTTSKRRIPCAIFNNGSGNISQFEDTWGGPVRCIVWDDPTDHRLLAAGTATAFTKVETVYNGTTAGIPPTACMALLHPVVYEVTLTVAGFEILYVRTNRGTSASGSPITMGTHCGTTAATAGTIWSFGTLPMESAGGVDYSLTTAVTANGAYLDAMGWWEIAT